MYEDDLVDGRMLRPASSIRAGVLEAGHPGPLITGVEKRCRHGGIGVAEAHAY